MAAQDKLMRHAVLAGAACVLIALFVIALRCRNDASVPFLPGSTRASWIVYPVPTQTRGRKSVELACEFHRSFTLANVPSQATLTVRSFRRGSIVLNGKELTTSPPPASWKRVATLDVAAALHTGRNDLSIVVLNEKGPPALWLRLSGQGLLLASDTSWETSLVGGSWEPARNATDSGTTPVGDRSSALAALGHVALPLCGLAVLAGLLIVAGSRSAYLREIVEGRRPLHVLGAAAIAWVLLFGNDVRLLPMNSGFDAEAHLSYILHIRDRKTLPLGDQGWEMYQPPLYYMVSAAALATSGAGPGELAGKMALRGVNLVAGLAQVAFIFLSLRLVFPARPKAQLAGGLLAAFVPVHLYLYQFPTNEALAATLVSFAVYLALRAIRQDDTSPRLLALLGAVLGAALLTKVTALLVVPAVLVALAVDRKGDTQRRCAWLMTLGIPLFVCVVVCGWHYARVWSHFGTPLVGNWDERVGAAWWQDPGYRTASYFFAFGRALAHPFFAGVRGFLDGLYSTFWGDGLFGGAPNAMMRPPWNYELMRVGYLLSSLPSVLILAGIGAGLVALWRRPRSPGVLLAGLAATTGLALIHMTLKIPSYAQVKAFYVLPAILPLCAAFGYAFDLAARRSKLCGGVLAWGIGVWAFVAYASFWIRPDSAATAMSLGVEKVLAHRPADAVPVLERAVERDPTDANARFWLGYALVETGKRADAMAQDRKSLELDPAQTYAAVDLAMNLDGDGKRDEALAVMRAAVAAAPDDPDALIELGRLLRSKGSSAEAIEALRRAIGRKPESAEAHDELGRAYADSGRLDEAAERLRYALRIEPSSADSKAALAAVLAARGKP